tara:strand:+ start:935 stop:1729 length:795 start_codon:yes stop_codon:yes gene_type:complete
MDYYELFQLQGDFTQKELKKKYHKLCIFYHPDKNPDVDPQKFIDIQTGYEILSNPIKKRRYDIHRQLPFLSPIELSEEEYDLLETYYNRFTKTNEYKFMELLYRSLPKQLISKIKRSLNTNHTNHTNHTREIVEAPKWIYIQGMKQSQTIHMYVSMEDSYQNKLKQVWIQTFYGIIPLFLREFNRCIYIDNKICYLTIQLHTKNGRNCYRKNDDLYYIVPAMNKYNIIHLPNKQSFMTQSSMIQNLGFKNGNHTGKLIIVKLIP